MSFSSIVFTSSGYTLQAKAQIGTPIIFTRIAMGDGKLTGQVSQELKNIINKKKDILLSKFQAGDDGTATMGGVLNNQDMSQGFYWREIGLFAQDPDDVSKEILYCYGNAGETAEYIPAGGESQILEKRIQLSAIIGNASNVSAQISNSTIFVTQADFDNEILPLKQQLTGFDTRIDENTKQITNLSGPYVIPEGTDIPIKDRKRGKMYFKVTARQSGGANESIKVSPTMGLKIQ